MRIGVYVGSFDPVHKGHKGVIDYLINNNYVDKILVIPTGNYWDKNELIDVNYRIEMLKKYQNDKIIIDEDMNDIPYTYLVLRELNDKYNSDDLYLIIGADNIVKFDLWKNVNEIINNNYILVLPREGVNIREYIKRFDNDNKFIVVNGFKEIDISSSMIRELIRNNNRDEVLKYLDTDIVDYINGNNLYK